MGRADCCCFAQPTSTSGWQGVRSARSARRFPRLLPGRRAVRFHDFRHTFASHLIMGTWGRAWRLEEVQILLGHTSITTTQRYAHLAPEGLARSVSEAEARWFDVTTGVTGSSGDPE